VQSIEAISFGPQGLLLIGDGRGSQVVAVDTGDTTAKLWSRTELKGIKDQLAGKVAPPARAIEIQKMAVNPASHTAYFAVRILDGKKDLVLTVDGTGQIKEFALDNVKHVRVPLPGDTKVTKITDITWAGDRVWWQRRPTRNSATRSLPSRPLDKGAQCVCFSAETYHVAHGKWETKAPFAPSFPMRRTARNSW